MSRKQHLRFAHSEGHTSLSFDDVGKHIATCGSDGDLRIWELPDYDTMTSHPIGAKAFAIHVRKSTLYVSNDNNGIPAMSFPFLEPEGYLSYFTAPVTCITSSKKGTIVCAGSSDFTIRVINAKDRSYTSFKHEAPVLSLSLDPKDEFLASSSCDGSVRVWKLSNKSNVKSWKDVVPKCNSFENCKVLCRMAWQPTSGDFLVVPTEKHISVYKRETWELMYTLEDGRIAASLSLAAFSPCATFLAGSCTDGTLIFWNLAQKKCIELIEHEKKATITDIEWNPSKKADLAYCDSEGELCIWQDVITITDDKLLTEDEALAAFAAFDDSDDENSFSISKIKAETVGMLEDSNDEVKISQNVQKKSQILDDASMDGITPLSPSENKENEFDEFAPIAPQSSFQNNFQDAFQSGSTPVHLSHRFMMWNSIGLITCHNTDEENAIDVEFHDAAVHHAMHVNNTMNYSMAALSNEAVLLACESEEDAPSTLDCMHFGSWDTCKEWTVPMNEKEDIHAVALGNGWAAACTDKRYLRLFTIGGLQLEVISLPGPVVSMSGHDEILLVAYHLGAGLPGEQSLAMMSVNVLARKVISSNVPLSLSPQASLMWLGFSDEGTPCFVDSNGFIKALSHSFNSTWMQICDTKSQAKGKSDHFFVVGLSETQQSVRCIPCKGSRYPATLPRPVVTIIPLQLPLCEMNTEKAKLEESIWRHKHLSETLEVLEQNSFEVDPETKESTFSTLKECIMKAFALACRADRECRAGEICELMTTSYAVQLAIRYASQQRHLQLAQRLSQVAYQKREEETRKQMESEEQHEEVVQPKRSNHVTHQESEVEEEEEENGDEATAEILVDEETNGVEDSEVATLKKSTNRKSFGNSKNPFKKVTPSTQSLATCGNGTDVFDKLSSSKSLKTNSGKSDEKETAANRKKTPSQSTLFSTRSQPEKNESNRKPRTTPFQKWFETVKDEFEMENPHLDENGIKKLARENFKKLSKEETPAPENGEPTRKRTRLSATEAKPEKLVKQTRKSTGSLSSGTNAKLSSFLFVKKD